MKATRILRNLGLLCGLALSFAVLGTDTEARAAICPGGAPSCVSASNCADYCIGETGFPQAICNRARCCVCLA